MTELTGDSGARYRLGPLLAVGGQGAVYAATDVADGHAVVVKVAHEPLLDGPFRASALRAAALAEDPVAGPHLVPVWDVGVWGDRPFVVLERLEHPLPEWLAAGGSPAEAAAALVAAVAALHRAGVVHGDLKPSNVFVVPGRPGGAAVLVGDLGAGSGEPTSSLGYSAPELWAGHPPTAASDRFALGATLWAIHAGSPPPCALGPARRPTRAEVRGSGLSARDAAKVVGWLEPSPALRPPLEARGPSPRALRRAAAGAAAGVALAAAAAAAWSPPPRCPAGWAGDGLRCAAPDGRQVARVPPGAWVAGVTGADDARWAPDATPTPTSITGAVWFRTTEVTQGEYAALVGHSPQAVRRETLPDGTSSPCSSWEGHPLIDPALPAACVTWAEAVAFANLASAADGLPPAYAVSPTGEVTWRRGAPGWRLPTEAEWEWAARGGPAGQAFAGAEGRDALCGFANVRDQSAPEFWGNEVACSDGAPVLAKVGSYQPNALGLYDMLGNVGEWTWDRWGDRDGRPRVDPVGAAAGEARVIRGTGWNQVGRPVSARYAGDPTARGLETGLRLVRDAGWSGGR